MNIYCVYTMYDGWLLMRAVRCCLQAVPLKISESIAHVCVQIFAEHTQAYLLDV